MTTPTVLAILWVGIWVVGGAIIISCALTRCPRCRGWHTSNEEQQECERNDNE